jgi:hypothetical protein
MAIGTTASADPITSDIPGRALRFSAGAHFGILGSRLDFFRARYRARLREEKDHRYPATSRRRFEGTSRERRVRRPGRSPSHRVTSTPPRSPSRRGPSTGPDLRGAIVSVARARNSTLLPSDSEGFRGVGAVHSRGRQRLEVTVRSRFAVFVTAPASRERVVPWPRRPLP